MARSPRRRLAAVLLVAALGTACSSTVSGSASPAAQLPTSAAEPDTTSSTPPSPTRGGTATPPPASGITVPPSGPATTTDEADGAHGTIGDAGIGDPYYPEAGNGGYQIDSYDVDLSYDPPTNALQSTATLKGSVLSEEGLTQFNLDLQPTMLVSEVTVNSAPATFEQDGAELVITPASLLAPQSALDVAVTYSGKPGLVSGGTGGSSDGGWYRTSSGGAFVAGEPTGASSWYPVNEHPADTATFAVTATVPKDWQVISNGIAQTDGLPDPGAGKSVFRWQLAEPVASYLTTIYIDDFTLVQDTLPDGKPIVSAIAPTVPDDADLASNIKKIIEVLSGYFGPYPFESVGGIFTGEKTGFALETATRPVFSSDPGLADVDTVVHELSHQWFGDDVTIERWSDICLNECFASYGTWLWNAEVNGEDLDATWKRQMSTAVNRPNFWSSPLVDMGPGNEFSRVYDRGPLALHALRNEIGDDAFLKLLKQWPAEHGGKNASFDDLQAAVNAVAGRDLGPFMDAWFRGTTVPAAEFRYPGDLGN